MSAMLVKLVAPMMPMYLMQLKAKLEIDLEEDDVAALMDLPQAEMAKANVHQFLSGMTPWGTLDDLELIQQVENDTNEYVLPVWNGVEGHEDFASPMEAVDAFFGKLTPILKGEWNEETMDKLQDFLFSGCGRSVEKRLFPHIASIIMGDEIEVEAGVRLSPDAEKYDKLIVRGAGLGQAIKAAMVVINQ